MSDKKIVVSVTQDDINAALAATHVTSLEDLGLKSNPWVRQPRRVNISDIAEEILLVIEEVTDVSFTDPRRSEDDDIVFHYTPDHYIRIRIFDEDNDPANGPEPLSHPHGAVPHGSPGHRFHDDTCPDDSDKTFTEDDQGGWHEVIVDGKPGRVKIVSMGTSRIDDVPSPLSWEGRYMALREAYDKNRAALAAAEDELQQLRPPF